MRHTITILSVGQILVIVTARTERTKHSTIVTSRFHEKLQIALTPRTVPFDRVPQQPSKLFHLPGALRQSQLDATLTAHNPGHLYRLQPGPLANRTENFLLAVLVNLVVLGFFVLGKQPLVRVGDQLPEDELLQLDVLLQLGKFLPDDGFEQFLLLLDDVALLEQVLVAGFLDPDAAFLGGERDG